MKRCLSLILVFCLLAGMLSVSVTAESKNDMEPESAVLFGQSTVSSATDFAQVTGLCVLNVAEDVTAEGAKELAAAKIASPTDGTIVLYGKADKGYCFVVADDGIWYDYTETHFDNGVCKSATYMRFWLGEYYYKSRYDKNDYFTNNALQYWTDAENQKPPVYVIGQVQADPVVNYAGKQFDVELNEAFLALCLKDHDYSGCYYEIPTGNYYLAEDTELAYNLRFYDTGSNLLLNGHVLKGDGTNAVIWDTTCELTIYGGDTTIEHRFRDTGTETDLWTWDDGKGTHVVSGGVITGGHTEMVGGGIMNCHGTVHLYDVNLVGNYAKRNGSALFNAAGEEEMEVITMKGGSIRGNAGPNTIVYNGYSYGKSASLTMDSVQVEYNRSETGAVASNCGYATVTDCSFRRNESKYGAVAQYGFSYVYGQTVVDGCIFTENRTQCGTVNVGGHFILKDSTITGNSITNTSGERLKDYGGAGIDFWGDYTENNDGYFKLQGTIICKDNYTNGAADNLLINLEGSYTQMIELEDLNADSEIGINHADVSSIPFEAYCVWGTEIPEGVFTADDPTQHFITCRNYYNSSIGYGLLRKIATASSLEISLDYSKLQFASYGDLVRAVAEDNIAYTMDNGEMAYGYMGLSILREGKTYDLLLNDIGVYQYASKALFESRPEVSDVVATIVRFNSYFENKYIDYLVEDGFSVKLNGESVSTGVYAASEYANPWYAALQGPEKVTLEYWDYLRDQWDSTGFYAYVHFGDIAALMEERAKTEGCVIEFVTNCLATISDIYTDYNTGIDAPAEPERENSTFLGWYDELGNKVDLADKQFTRSTVLTARWLQNQSEADTVVPTAYDEGGTTAKIRVEGDSNVAAGGLDEIAAEIKSSYTDVNIKLVLTAETKTESELDRSTETEAIKEAAGSNKKIEFLDIKLEQFVGTDPADAIHDTGSNVVEIILPCSLSGKTLTGIYRYHAEQVDSFTEDTAKTGAADSYYYENGMLHIFATKFSTYAVSYTVNSSVVSMTKWYAVMSADSENGNISLSKSSAVYGDIITVTAAADEGYTVESVTVRNASGKEVEVQSSEPGKLYTFRMPASSVTVTAVFKAEEAMVFEDVKETDYFYSAVYWAAKLKITLGTDATHFSPRSLTTRGEMITFLWRACGSPAAETEIPFTDVKTGAYYEEAVRWGTAMGYVKGTSAVTFSPNQTVTRAQCVTFLARMAGIEDYADAMEQPFSDVSASAYYNNAVAWAAAQGISRGTSSTEFSPKKDCSRREMITMLYRYFVK